MSEDKNRPGIYPVDTHPILQQSFPNILNSIFPGLSELYAFSPAETKIQESLGDPAADFAEWITRYSLYLRDKQGMKPSEDGFLRVSAAVAKELKVHVLAYHHDDNRQGYIINVVDVRPFRVPIFVAQVDQIIDANARVEWEGTPVNSETVEDVNAHIGALLDRPGIAVAKETLLALVPVSRPIPPNGGEPLPVPNAA